MRYTGRILAVALAVFLNATGYSYIRFAYGVSDWSVIVFISVLGAFGWFLGKRFDKMKYLSEKDILTEIYNRRFILGTFPKLISLTERKREKLVVLLIDIDNFKSINDQFSHEMGDQVLRQLSGVLLRIVRKSDFVVRWGGDEFLIVLPCTTESAVELVQDRLHNELRGLSGQLAVKVSVSMGHAIYPAEGDNLGDLLKIADQRMYNLKFGRAI